MPSHDKLFIQATKGNTKDILKIKEAFSKLLAKKIIKIHNVVHNSNQKICPKINMTTKGPSRKQVIISMSENNIYLVASKADKHIFNINRLLKLVRNYSRFITNGHLLICDYRCYSSKCYDLAK